MGWTEFGAEALFYPGPAAYQRRRGQFRPRNCRPRSPSGHPVRDMPKLRSAEIRQVLPHQEKSIPADSPLSIMSLLTMILPGLGLDRLNWLVASAMLVSHWKS